MIIPLNKDQTLNTLYAWKIAKLSFFFWCGIPSLTTQVGAQTFLLS